MKRKILDPKILMKRAQKQARGKVAKRILKGKSMADLGMGQKRALEKILDKKTKAISKLAKKMLKVVRQKEMSKGKKSLKDVAPLLDPGELWVLTDSKGFTDSYDQVTTIVAEGRIRRTASSARAMCGT